MIEQFSWVICLCRYSGVLNGIDTVMWDPAKDPYLPFNFDGESLVLLFRTSLAEMTICNELPDGHALNPILPIIMVFGSPDTFGLWVACMIAHQQFVETDIFWFTASFLKPPKFFDLGGAAKDLVGKQFCKHYIQRGLGLEFNQVPMLNPLTFSQNEKRTPLVVCITRLVPQKGIHLIRHAILRVAELVS